MANPIRGEVPIDIDGKRYTFVLGTYGLAALERRMRQPWVKIFKRASDGDWGIDDLLAVFHAGLLKHHRDLTEEQVAELIDAAGLGNVTRAITEAVELMQPEASAGGAAGENPQKAANGNGVGMTS